MRRSAEAAAGLQIGVLGFQLQARPVPHHCVSICQCIPLRPLTILAGVLAVVRSWQNEYVQPFTGMVPITTGELPGSCRCGCGCNVGATWLEAGIGGSDAKHTNGGLSPAFGMEAAVSLSRAGCFQRCSPSAAAWLSPHCCRRGGGGPGSLPGGQRADSERAGPGRVHCQGPQVRQRALQRCLLG